MPRSSVKSLFETCLDYVKSHMEEVTKIYQRPAILGNYVGEPCDSESAFDIIAPVVLEELCRHLARKNELKWNILKALITPSLRSLDLSVSIYDIYSVPDLLSLAVKKCPHLKSLRLGRFSHFLKGPEYLQKFTHLKVLDIGGYQTAHSLLPLIVNYCEDLWALHLNNSLVSDTDIQCLIKKFKAIRLLNLTKTKVTWIGVLNALNNLPALRELRHEDTVEALDHSERYSLAAPIVMYSLSTLSVTYDSTFSMGSLSKAVALCPSLTKVEIKAPEGFNDDNLLELLNVTNLRHLKISAILTNNISFYEGVASLFRHTLIGNSLESLYLSHLCKVQIRTITEYCPNLRFLNLHRNKLLCFTKTSNEEDLQEVESLNNIPPKIPENLEFLNLDSCDCSKNLILLLSSPALISVTLSNCLSLSDQVFQTIAEINAFPNLLYFEIISNSRITEEGIETLMTESNPLKVMKLRGCTKLTEKNIEDWKQKSRDANWNLSITKETA